jgi:hypothetical protein
MMPFKSDFDDVYDIIRQAVDDVANSIAAIRLDEVKAAGSITEDMLGEIERATMCIADITDSNANVMWEVGYAAALKKPTIIIHDEGYEPPFDIRHLRRLPYSRTSLSRTLRSQLKDAIEDTMKRYTLAETRASASSKPAAKTIAVTGSMEVVPERARFRVQRVLQPYIGHGNSWLVGSSGVIDDAIVDFLIRKGERSIQIVGYTGFDISGNLLAVVEAQPDIFFIDASLEQSLRVPDAPSQRDVFFAARSDLLIIFWNGLSKGTRDLINWVGAQGKDHLLSFVPPTYYESAPGDKGGQRKL